MAVFNNNLVIALCTTFIIVIIVVPYYTFRFLRKVSDRASHQVNSRLSIAVGHHSAIGKRATMEDGVSIDLDLLCNSELDFSKDLNSSIACIGVYDGHCGKDLAEFASKNFAQYVRSCDDTFSQDSNEVCKSLCKVFLDFDKATESMQSGCTAVVAIINP